MGVFGYADDLSLLCPSFTGIKEMLNICENICAMKYDDYLMQQKVNNYILVTIVIMITCSQF